jgi:hypothetical protein
MYQYLLGNDVLLACGRDGNCGGYGGRVLDPGHGYVRDLEDAAARQKQAQFHIVRGDYFATIATVCHIAAKEEGIDMRKIFEKLAEDLQYLQENYEIRKKE